MKDQHQKPQGIPGWLSGGGESGALLRSIDWSQTALGPIAGWPSSLKTILGALLHSKHPMFLWWGPALIQFYNDAYKPSFGLGKHPQAMGQRGAECWPEIWPIIGPQIEDVMERGIASWNEDQLVPIFRNGRIEECYWTYGYSPVMDDEDRIGGTLVICTETTTRVIASRRLFALHSLAMLTDAIAESASIGAAVARLFEGSNEDASFCIVVGCGREGEKHVAEVAGLSHEQATAWLGALGRRLVGGRVELPGDEHPDGAYVVRLTRAGSELPRGFLVFGLSPRLPFDQEYGAFFERVGSQVTTALMRIEALEARDVIERERNNLLMQAPISISLLTGPDHVYRLVNARYLQMVQQRDVLGKTFSEAFPEVAGTDMPRILDRVYQLGEPFVSVEHKVQLDLDGQGLKDRYFRFNLEPIRDAAGLVYGMMSCALDITDQVLARQEVVRAHDERAFLLSELEAANRAKDEFLAMLGHELRNPLAPIVTALELMKAHHNPHTERERLVVERQVQHLVRLVDDLLDISKITRGKVELKKDLVELWSVVGRAVEMASFLFEQRGHQLELDVPRQGLAWQGDPTRLSQVLANLLTNAARYTDPGGHIRVTVFRAGQEAVLRVTDNGKGIAPDLLPQIFELFVQGPRGDEGGLGIGLSLAKNLVHMHGGTITATSPGLGQGSTFEVRVPGVVDEVPLIEERSAPFSSPLPGSKRILVVDDNVDAGELLGAALELSGHEVAVCFSPLDALSKLDEFRPELVVLDIGMPVMDGYELAARMRQTEAGRSCRLIALTGYGQEHDRARSHSAGFAAHLVKPIDLKALLRLAAET